jgi:hypothetical protein
MLLGQGFKRWRQSNKQNTARHRLQQQEQEQQQQGASGQHAAVAGTPLALLQPRHCRPVLAAAVGLQQLQQGQSRAAATAAARGHPTAAAAVLVW